MTLPVIAYGVNSRACIVRKQDIKMMPVAHILTSDMAVGLWTTPTNDKIVCSAYFPFDGGNRGEHSFLRNKGKGIILLCQAYIVPFIVIF